MIAEKGNRVYQVDKVTKNAYLKDGFTIKDDKGKVLEYPGDKTITWAEHEVLVKEHEVLVQEHDELLGAYKVLEEKLAEVVDGKESTVASGKKA